jgi:hypothetical protein
VRTGGECVLKSSVSVFVYLIDIGYAGTSGKSGGRVCGKVTVLQRYQFFQKGFDAVSVIMVVHKSFSFTIWSYDTQLLLFSVPAMVSHKTTVSFCDCP